MFPWGKDSFSSRLKKADFDTLTIGVKFIINLWNKLNSLISDSEKQCTILTMVELYIHQYIRAF